MAAIISTQEIISQVSPTTLQALYNTDRFWQELRGSTIDLPNVIRKSSELLSEPELDIVVCGGTLGIFIAASLQKLGWRVGLIERGILKGREQEWNISRQELEVFLELDLLTPKELETAIATEYNPGRVSFLQGEEIWVKDVLNIGIDPIYLLETLKNNFLAWGGKLLERSPFQGAVIHPNGVNLATGNLKITSRLLIDAMGHFSPIAKQARQGEKPEGVCVVVGSCARGYQKNDTGDLIVSFTPIQNQCQYFWEAFPARDGRTTYMFSYLDAHPDRPSLEFFMDEYLRLLPEYQNTELSQLEFQRFLFGFFPAYRQSPLRLPWNRLLAVGDSSGSQSPVSFGGFGAMVRHLPRLSRGIDEALKLDLGARQDLALLQPYQPNISVTWLFQRTMRVGLDRAVPPQQINQLMSGVFEVMEKLGEDVLNPFLKDTIQFPALAKTLLSVNPLLALPILPQVGMPMLLDWSIHFANLGLYSSWYSLGKLITKITNNLSPKQQYYYHRWMDSFYYGSGLDYKL